MRRIVFAAVAVAFGSSLASAADMPATPVYKAPAASSVWNWTGFYIGGSVGGAWSTMRNSLLLQQATFDHNSSNAIAGGQIGYQRQFTNILLGIEASVASTFRKDLGSAGCNPVASCSAGYIVSARLDDALWTIGSRFGWANGQWMPYLAGGYATSAIEQTACRTAVCPVETGKARYNGWYIGGGLDWALTPNSWILGVEYRHYDFGTKQVVPIRPTGVPNTNDTWNSHPSLDTVTLRLSYLFH